MCSKTMIFQCLQHQTRGTILKHSSSSQGEGERKARLSPKKFSYGCLGQYDHHGRDKRPENNDRRTRTENTSYWDVIWLPSFLNLIALRMNSNRLPSPEVLMFKDVLPAFLTLLFTLILSIVLDVPQICQDIPHFKNVDLAAPYASKYPLTTFSSMADSLIIQVSFHQSLQMRAHWPYNL